MARPTLIPGAFGSACWNPERAETLISTTAQVDVGRATTFLACHSPLKELRTGTAQIDETQAFNELVKGRSAERIAIVKGEPGSGKSHLINWFRLRFDDAVANGELKTFKSVMVTRRSGSLRDA